MATQKDTKDTLGIFRTNDVDRLFTVAQRLWTRRVFDYYLTAQQLLVLERIFDGAGSLSKSKNEFVRFLQGEVSLKFVEQKAPAGDVEINKDEQLQANEGQQTPSQPQSQTQSQTQAQTQPQSQSQSVPPQGKPQEKEEEPIVEVTIPNGVESARSLALKVRYILWDKAIDCYYDEDDTTEYEIFEPEEDTDAAITNAPVTVSDPVRKVDEDDDYDDDDDDDQNDDSSSKMDTDSKAENSSASTSTTTDDSFDSNGNLILEVPIAVSEPAHIDTRLVIENFNKIYHNFENDKETLIKRRKLEENDKLLETDNSGSTSDLISMNLGAANLSLKHLLRSIDDNKEKLNLGDTELRQLIMDVRKNRSKWASDDKIGQEELYEACEKVVMELRGYAEHSTPFLNRVPKRDAPNYYQIIKKPMDLNTILKKLKTFQYKSKTEFVDDVMLIWKNCFTYNTDPRHFLRAHALAMQKKSQQLIPLIPEITVRERAEVEAELEAEAEAEAGAEDASTPAPSGKTSSKKGMKRARNGEIKQENASSSIATNAPPSASASVPPRDTPTPAVQDVSSTAPPPSANGTAPPPSGTATPALENTTLGAGDNTEMDEDDENNNAETNDYLNNEDNDKDDLETQMWKNLTSKARSDFCIKRSDLFKENNELNGDSEAILRDPKKMKTFVSFLKNYSETKKHIFSVSNKQTEEDPYLIEYDITGGLPSIAYRGMSDEQLDAEESKLVEQVLSEGLKPSEFVPAPGGLNKVINSNIEEMQEIRRICFKISLIRQMQQQQFVHHSQMRAPEIEKIDDSIDIDPVSRLKNHEKMNKELIYCVMRKRVSKVAMLSGFESTEMGAIDTLTQIAGDYMDNLVRTIKTHLETPSVNKKHKEKNILTLSLLQNGISKPDELHTYVRENVISQHTKLRDLKNKLVNFLKALLRPAIEMTDKNFSDNSEQFISGDFSNEIGEDFFGFKELGLDKEFGMLGGTLPLHLLHSKLNEANSEEVGQTAHREEFEKAPFPRVKDVDIGKQIGLFQPFLLSCLEKTKQFQSKQLHLKTKKEIQDYMNSAKNLDIMEDIDVPAKKPKSKLPPNGKIPHTKRKITPLTFFLPENDADIGAPAVHDSTMSTLTTMHTSMLDNSSPSSAHDSQLKTESVNGF
ncbi:CYFA0S25e00936g1_1 [Cyberlindnera fabianii]|uniref:SAGA complex subunit Spt7 n=1 Tax=Cyberlindnera fabianii TaxID=36022 RepID=A0A061B9S6_CYBFA|nr:CYFA0S25e00936g1_1 [Cyberlindnera fabianii]